MVIAKWRKQIVAAAMLMGAGVTAAVLATWSQGPVPTEQPPVVETTAAVRPAEPVQAKKPAVDFTAMLNRDLSGPLFDKPAPAAPAPAPAPAERPVLMGTMIDSAASFAVLRGKDGVERLLAKGDIIDGARILDILPNRVVLDINGQQVALDVSTGTATAVANGSPRGPGATSPSAAATGDPSGVAPVDAAGAAVGVAAPTIVGGSPGAATVASAGATDGGRRGSAGVGALPSDGGSGNGGNGGNGGSGGGIPNGGGNGGSGNRPDTPKEPVPASQQPHHPSGIDTAPADTVPPMLDPTLGPDGRKRYDPTSPFSRDSLKRRYATKWASRPAPTNQQPVGPPAPGAD